MAATPLPLNAFIAIQNQTRASEPFWRLIKQCLDHASNSISKDSAKVMSMACVGSHVTMKLEGNGVAVHITQGAKWQFQVHQSREPNGRLFALSPVCLAPGAVQKPASYDKTFSTFEGMKFHAASDAFNFVAEPVGQMGPCISRILPRLLKTPSDAIALVTDACMGQRPKLTMRMVAFNDTEHFTSLDAIKHIPPEAYGMLGDVFDVPSPRHSDWHIIGPV